MDGDKLSQVIAAIEDASNDEDALRRALLFLLAILQRPETYNNSKSRPLSEFKELVHWTLLAFSPIARHVSGSEGLNLSHGFRARRKLNADGKFSIEIDGLFPPKVEESLPTYEYDVCISFAGEQRNIAESLATKMKEEFYLRVFYDDFEKLDLWGRDLFKHLYEVYSIKSQYCIVLFSDAYLAKNWTAHELRAAQSRIIKERSPYVLPVLIDPTVEPPREF
ncbi:MAG: TIR domain-containing protein, partial [Candidatus Thiodiazotropha sp.]